MDFDNDYDMFDKFVKGDDGIYKIVKRSKRTVGLKALDLGLRNIPPLMPAEVSSSHYIVSNCYYYSKANIFISYRL